LTHEREGGVWNVDVKKDYLLTNPEWRYDTMPEIMEGKNIADFVDPDIMKRLEELENEEERLEEEGFYDSDGGDDESNDPSTSLIRETASLIRTKKAQLRLLNFNKNKQQNKPIMPRTVQHRTLTDMTAKLTEAGLDPSNITDRARVMAQARGLIGNKRPREDDTEMDVDSDSEVDETEDRKKRKTEKGVVKVNKRIPGKDRSVVGLRDGAQAKKAQQLKFLYQRGPNRMAKASESDRAIKTKMPKHLFSGKRKSGKTNRR